ncbi:MAG TPA: FAD-dependent oxidoreductase [Candidatus Dormibacteraeota bacterium]|nr:FAD-dependent oxidoreductase [Candidatus Dormibacteraeota bacterium]
MVDCARRWSAAWEGRRHVRPGGGVPTLDPADLALISDLGQRRQVDAGDYLYREGDLTYDFFAVTSAEVDIVVSGDGGETLITHHGPGGFLGELNMLSGLRVLVSARVVRSGEVVVVARDRLRPMMATHPRLGDIILAGFVARRILLMTEAAAAIRVIGSHFSPESLRIREVLTRTRVPHEWLDSDQDPHVEAMLRELGMSAIELPVVIVTGSVLRRPTPGELASYLGLTVESLPDRHFDLVVVGGGPAGLAAAVYGASEGLRTLGVDMTAPGGQAGMSSRIENYLGFPMGVSGAELTQRAVAQAEKFGATLTAPCTAVSLRNQTGYLVVRLSDGSEVSGRAVIAATGAAYRRLEASRLSEFEGNGVYYAATEMEARMCGAGPVTVVGGGNSAGQAAIFLGQCGCAVTLVIRGADLSKSMSRYLMDRIEADPLIALRAETSVVALEGEETMRAVRLRGPDGEVVVECAGLFSFIGAAPSSGWLSGCAALDGRGFVLTDLSLGPDHLGEGWEALARLPLPFETNHPGLFAVGDLRSGSTKRVAAAVGEGSSAVRAVHQYLAFA